jgi:hypothetical protein
MLQSIKTYAPNASIPNASIAAGAIAIGLSYTKYAAQLPAQLRIVGVALVALGLIAHVAKLVYNAYVNWAKPAAPAAAAAAAAAATSGGGGSDTGPTASADDKKVEKPKADVKPPETQPAPDAAVPTPTPAAASAGAPFVPPVPVPARKHVMPTTTDADHAEIVASGVNPKDKRPLSGAAPDSELARTLPAKTAAAAAAAAQTDAATAAASSAAAAAAAAARAAGATP